MTITYLRQKRRALLKSLKSIPEEIRKIDVQIAVAGRMSARFPDDQEGVRQKVKRWASQGNDMKSIAHELNMRHIPQPSGQRWSAVSLERWAR